MIGMLAMAALFFIEEFVLHVIKVRIKRKGGTMKQHDGFEGIDFSDWLMFKMIIKIYGEDKLIEVLTKIKDNGGIKVIRTLL